MTRGHEHFNRFYGCVAPEPSSRILPMRVSGGGTDPVLEGA